MDASFWNERWREGRIGFHEGRPNTFLERHVGRLGMQRRVLVPLCGKTEDLSYLAAHGHTVVGVELVEDAVRAFFAEHAITPEVSRSGSHTEYRAGAITILAGDFFAVTPDQVGAVDALYDRAALVALPATVRPRYVEQVRALVPLGSPGLVVTIEYAQAAADGPPFAVLEPEARALYGAASELLDEQDANNARLREAGVVTTERCFAVTL